MSRNDTIGMTHTTVYSSGRHTCVKYHATEVVRFSASEIILHSGGWNTNTTKLRMNQTAAQYDLPYSVYQRNHKWFVSVDGFAKPFDFFEGFTLVKSGDVWCVLRPCTRDDFISAEYREEFHHITSRNADGTPSRCRVNGRCKTWKTRPNDFHLPVKHGLRDAFYIRHDDIRTDVWCQMVGPFPVKSTPESVEECAERMLS